MSAVVSSLPLAAVIPGLLCAIAALLLTNVTSSTSTSYSAAALSAVTVVVAVLYLFCALGDRSCFFSPANLAGVLFALRGLIGGSLELWALSGIVLVLGLFFWELAALNISLVPAFAMVL